MTTPFDTYQQAIGFYVNRRAGNIQRPNLLELERVSPSERLRGHDPADIFAALIIAIAQARRSLRDSTWWEPYELCFLSPRETAPNLIELKHHYGVTERTLYRRIAACRKAVIEQLQLYGLIPDENDEDRADSNYKRNEFGNLQASRCK